MSRKKPNITEIGNGIRMDCNDFFMYEITPVEHRKHTTPFIFYLNGKVEVIYYLKELLQKANDNDIILKAWVGQWRTDIFAFKLSELKEHINNTNNHKI
jgi:hypothetical protein